VLAHGEVERLAKAGFLERSGPAWSTVTARWPNAICTRLACLVRPGAGGALKIRLIVDMRRSGVNGIAKITERIVLPRPGDAVEAIRHCMGADSRGELMKADFADAFPSLGVLEAERGMVVVTDGVEYFAYRGVPFGLRPAVVIWGASGRMAVEMCSGLHLRPRQACHVRGQPPHCGCRQPSRPYEGLRAHSAHLGCCRCTRVVEEDLPWCMTRVVRHRVLIEPDRIRTTIEVNRIHAVKTEILRMLAAKGIVTRVQQLAGLLSWVAGIVPRLRPFVRPLWAAFATPRLDRQFPLLGREQRPRFIII
jgi:hypothetical protein